MMKLQLPTDTKLKQMHWLKQLARSWKTITVPSPTLGTRSIQWFWLSQLCTFILQCKLNFQDHKALFEDNTNKVNYVLSFLKGTALDCFESTILDPIEPIWLLVFNLFFEELKANLETMIQLAKQKLNLKDFTCTKAIKLWSTSSNSSS